MNFPRGAETLLTRGIDGATKFSDVSAASHKTKGESEERWVGEGEKKGKNISYTPSGLVLDKFPTSWKRVSRRIPKITYQQVRRGRLISRGVRDLEKRTSRLDALRFLISLL